MKLMLQPTHAFLGFPFGIPCLRSNVATWGQVYIQRCIKGAWIKHFLYQIYLKLLPLYKQLFKTSTTKMKSVCLILLAMALYCDAAASRQKREEGCACDGTKVETNDRFGTILGECLTQILYERGVAIFTSHPVQKYVHLYLLLNHWINQKMLL